MDIKLKGFLTNALHLGMTFLLLALAMHYDMKWAGIALVASLWSGLQDALWHCVPEEKRTPSEIQYWIYHHARLWLFFIGCTLFAFGI